MVLGEHNKEFDPQFDAMLREHVRREQSKAKKSCLGFDPDTATAYLEQALSSQAKVNYENHLADCSSCRRHLVELSRLMPEIAAESVPVVAQPNLNNSIRERLASISRWFVLPKGRWLALSGAGFAALLLVLAITPMLRQRNVSYSPGALSSNEQRAENATKTASPSLPVEVTGNQAVRDRAQASSAEADQKAYLIQTPQAPQMLQKDVLTHNPKVSGTVQDPSGAAIANAQVKLINSASQQAVNTTTNSAGEFEFSNVPPGRYVVEAQAPGFTKQQNVADAGSSNDTLALKLQPGSTSETVTVTGEIKAEPLANKHGDVVTISKPDVLAQRRRAEEAITSPEARQRDERLAERESVDLLAKKEEQEKRRRDDSQPTALANAAEGSAKDQSSERSLKMRGRVAGPALAAPPAARKAAEISTRRIGEKTFHLENNVWVDNQYKPADNLPVTRLTHGSSEFNDVLAKNSGLKPFFELKSVIVVWQGKVYRVEAK